MTDLRALTIRQPWCEAVADGIKLVENRSQGFPKRHRGLVLIHAAKGWSKRAVWDPRIQAAWKDKPYASPPQLVGWGNHRNACQYAIDHVPAYHGRPPRPFEAGKVLALAELADVHPASDCCAPWGEETYPPANPEQRPPGRVTHLVFERPIRIVPVVAKGALGLWKPDEDLTLEVAHRLADLRPDDPDARALADARQVEVLYRSLAAA